MTTNYLSILAETIRTNWNQPALTDFYLTEDGTAQDTSRGNHYTYGEMYAEICRVAELLTALGLQKGDHIAICGANSAHWVIAYLAIAKMQGVSVTVMHSLQPDEIARLVAFSDAKALFTDEDIWGELQIPNRKSLIENQECDLSVVLSLSDWSILHSICSQSRWSTDGQPTVSYDVTATQSKEYLLDELVNGNWTNGICLDDLAMICFTSGTSGKPKGVVLTNNNVSVNALNGSKSYPDGDSKNVLLFIPVAHVLCLYGDLLGQLIKGEAIFLLREISINTIYHGIKILEPYAMNMIPQVVSAFLHLGDDGLSVLKKCQQIYIGGAKLDDAQYEELKNAGIHSSVGYGMTETGPISWYFYNEYRKGTCGKICKTLTARISPAGEILVKGENVMLGYYKDSAATAAKIDSDGWLHTGDKGHLDEDGYLYVEGRLEQDIIVLPNGENIRPDNIESLINALPEVKESIVLAREGKLVAIAVVANLSNLSNLYSASSKTNANSVSISSLRRTILRTVNPQLPLFSQLYDVEITDTPLQRTEKQTIKRYLYS